MYLFKAAGTTYQRVARRSKHAFPYAPAEVTGDEFVLLAKNKDDCRPPERQIQYVAKILEVRAPEPGELAAEFPNVAAEQRWSCVVALYWGRKLLRPFNLSEVKGLDYKRYDPVQNFAILQEPDALAVVTHLEETNPQLLLEFINEAERP